MKNFFKKNTKIIVTVFFTVLLVVLVGTANNYETYWDMFVREHFLSESTVEFMREVYGEVSAINWNKDSTLYHGTMQITTQSRGNTYGSKLVEMLVDSKKYRPNDTVNVTIDNKLFSDIEFYVGKYELKIYLDKQWLMVHSGAINANYSEVIRLTEGETYEFEIPLNYVREVSDEPISLIAGRYSLSVPVFARSDPDKGEKEDGWLTCEFEIK